MDNENRRHLGAEQLHKVELERLRTHYGMTWALGRLATFAGRLEPDFPQLDRLSQVLDELQTLIPRVSQQDREKLFQALQRGEVRPYEDPSGETEP
jgi:hypothetical protein